MAITRQQLKVGLEVSNEVGDKGKVVYINHTGFIVEQECGLLISLSEKSLSFFSLAPKPKKKIKLVGYVGSSGYLNEVEEDSEGDFDQQELKHKRIFCREVEVEDA